MSDNGLIAGGAGAFDGRADALPVHVVLQVAQHGVQLARLGRLGVRRVVRLLHHRALVGGGVDLPVWTRANRVSDLGW